MVYGMAMSMTIGILNAFYKDDLELKAHIEEEAKRQRIKELEKQITSYQNDLNMLKKEMNDDESV